MERQILTVSGQVQGIGFRYHVQKQASRRGLSGFVRNLENGDVHIEAQGEEEKLLDFQQSIRKKIPFATVLHIQVEKVALLQEDGRFKVKY